MAGDGGTASQFLATIAHQLTSGVKQLQMVQSVGKAIDLDANISDKRLTKQFAIVAESYGFFLKISAYIFEEA
ncbi:hypothetical protein NHQ30_010130 [Ciborinia camelliae]|nr:hypothetical protein NHQ30_010130 [Ciborinia camelliae]